MSKKILTDIFYVLKIIVSYNNFISNQATIAMCTQHQISNLKMLYDFIIGIDGVLLKSCICVAKIGVNRFMKTRRIAKWGFTFFEQIN